MFPFSVPINTIYASVFPFLLHLTQFMFLCSLVSTSKQRHSCCCLPLTKSDRDCGFWASSYQMLYHFLFQITPFMLLSSFFFFLLFQLKLFMLCSLFVFQLTPFMFLCSLFLFQITPFMLLCSLFLFQLLLIITDYLWRPIS